MRCAAETEWDWLTNESVKADEVTNLIHGFIAMTEGERGRQRTTIERMNKRRKDDVMILDLFYHASCSLSGICLVSRCEILPRLFDSQTCYLSAPSPSSFPPPRDQPERANALRQAESLAYEVMW